MVGLINSTAGATQPAPGTPGAPAFASPAAPAATGPPAAPEAPGAGSSVLENPLLKQMENALEAKLTPENRADYNKIVVAGLHIVLDRGPDGFMAKLLHRPDPIGDCAKGAVALMLIMQKQSRGVMPEQAGIPAAITLMLHGLDFIDHAGVVKIAEPELDRATTQFMNQLLFKLGISPEMLQHATQRVHQLVQDPDAMARINLKAGLTRHPDAATITPVPGLTAPPAAAAAAA
jgi:hypothetical protein